MSSTSHRSASWRAVDDNPDTKIAYLELLSAQLGALKRSVTELLALQPGEHALEIGCGMGHETQDMALRVAPGGRAVGLDFSAELIGKAVARTAGMDLDLSYRQGDAQALPFESDSFDAVRIERTLQHLADPQAAIDEAVRVLRSGGRIVVFEPDWDTVVVSGGDIAVQRAIRTVKTDITSAHGAIGRDVPALLVRAGCRLLSVDAGLFCMRSLSLADATLGLAQGLDAAVAQGAVTAEAGKAWWAAMQERNEADAFFALIAGSIVLGRVE